MPITLDDRKKDIEANREQFTPERLAALTEKLNSDRAKCSLVLREFNRMGGDH